MALQFKKGKHWEEMPEDMLPPVPDGLVEYRFTQTFADFQAGALGAAGPKRMLYRNNITLSPIFNYRDGNKVMRMGIIGGYDNEGNPNAGEVRQLDFKPQELGGILQIQPAKSEEDLDLFYALHFHPEVADADVTVEDTSAQPMQRINRQTESKANSDNRKARAQAFAMAEGFSDDEMQRAGHIFGFNQSDVARLRDEVETYAFDNPADFMQKWNDPNASTLAMVKQSLYGEKPVLKIDAESKTLRWASGNGVIMPLASTQTGDVEQAAAAYFADPKNAELLKTLGKALPKRASDVKQGANAIDSSENGGDAGSQGGGDAANAPAGKPAAKAGK